MKKLISIKTDESGEVVSFIHEKGVDTFNKSEIVKVDLVSSSTLKRKENFVELFLSSLIIFGIVFLVIRIIWLFVFEDFTFFSWWLILGFSCYVFWPRRNTRNNLNVYVSNRKTEKYKYNEEKEDIAEEIQKYLYHNHKLDIQHLLESGNLIPPYSLKDAYIFSGIIVFISFLDLMMIFEFETINFLHSPIFYFSVFSCFLSIIFIVIPYINKRKKIVKSTINQDLTDIILTKGDGFCIFFKNPEKSGDVITIDEITRIHIINYGKSCDFFLSYINKNYTKVEFSFIPMSEDIYDIKFILKEHFTEIQNIINLENEKSKTSWLNQGFTKCKEGHLYEVELDECPYCKIEM